MQVLTIPGLLLAFGAAAQQPADTVPLYDDLGDHHHAITTSSAMAQKYFDQGLRLVYGFNHAEAIASFRQALAHDDACAMCYWGVALAYGPNINLPMDSASGAAAYEATKAAVKLASKATPVERALIGAIEKRYGPDPTAARAQFDSAYAREMGRVAEQFPEDDDALTLYADALMNLAPWVYWTENAEPRPDTPDMIESLEKVMERNRKHAGACHLFIHVVEAEFPERAEPCADRLAGLMPGAGHIVHMPGHIYIRVGRYEDAIRANQHAIHEDESFIADRNPSGVYPLGYYPHNYHFLNFAAMMAGNETIAVQSAHDLAAKARPDIIRLPGLSGFLQHYLEAPLFAFIRFEKWDEVLAEPAPPSDLTYATGLWHYGRGIAYARTGDVQRADAELAALRTAAEDQSLEELYILSYNTAKYILGIAEATLAGEVAAAKKDWIEAEKQLTRAVELEDGLVYIEPPEWSIPPRQHLGRVQIEAGRLEAARATFEADLERFPKNVWSIRSIEQIERAQVK
jgi:tetratricopeptide (TPR) repeat protein